MGNVLQKLRNRSETYSVNDSNYNNNNQSGDDGSIVSSPSPIVKTSLTTNCNIQSGRDDGNIIVSPPPPAPPTIMTTSPTIEGEKGLCSESNSPSSIVVEHDETNQQQTLNNNNDDSKNDDSISDAPVLTYRDTGRRKSVFAEAYNPEEDDTEEKTVVYPKSDQQRQSLLEAVRGSLLFRSLDQEQLGQVLDAMFERSVASGENIIRQGDDGDNFYIIESGIYDIYVKTGDSSGDKAIGNYDNTGSFGELALMYNMPRAATIKAVTDGLLWAMDRSTFRKIVLRNAFQKRQMYEKLLESVPLLSTLSPYERMNLADALVSRSFDSGEIIVKQGNVADGMYFIEDGRVSISMMNNDQEKFIKNQEKGEYFGELALVTHKPRAATVKAEGNVRLAFLDVKAFERLLGPCLELMEKNIPDYEEQIVRIFGSKAAISDVR
ncbi:cAMP-dependent protein kinase type II regulatory subunit isoform X2 [Lepeophtheirus salmonis]|uniref:cAMP-dependent protein kinase type II regulatory subunit n=1 Tax=Lepeophtheirus salmonis TaxID=72036 RepID=A0A0K2TWX6_LEPSM|nr:cAMP-dependent protein kinase type II regulatory subunit-like isoform X2 [Lepeophtheirus salmonis]XP_040573303.1 cAMP-dependent protein kinase type II regulatory subunit-like isoform X2 [Lepeophtheirus salmonis]